MADDLSKGSDTDVGYSSYFEDENKNELEHSDPDYDVIADTVAKGQGMPGMFEEDFCNNAYSFWPKVFVIDF